MGAFEYKALDKQGKERKGVLEGDGPRQIRQQLREKGLAPINVVEVRQREGKQSGGGGGVRIRRGISAGDLALITRQFSTLVRSGTPVEEAIRAMSQQSEKPRIKSMLLAVRSRVVEGYTLAQSLEDFPRVFPDLYRATVAAGEQSGHLDAVLDRLADYTEARQILRQKMMQALVYPALIVVVAVTVIYALLVYVVPQVIQVFDNFDQELPILTISLIAVSDFLKEYGAWMLLALIGAFLAVRMALKRPAIKTLWHRWVLTLPLFGRLSRGLNTARFARTFSILTNSGVPVLEGLRISAQVVTNLPMRSAVEEVARNVREGASISGSLEKSGFFPPMAVHLIGSGEASGDLDEMLERAAVSQEREMESTVSMVMAIFEPLMIVVMGLIVLLIVLAVLLPIFDLNQIIQ